MFLHTSLSMLNPPTRQTNLRRYSLMKHDVIIYINLLFQLVLMLIIRIIGN